MKRKVSHKHRLKVLRKTTASRISIGELVQFRYMKSNINDLKPVVYDFDKESDNIKGINLNYIIYSSVR